MEVKELADQFKNLVAERDLIIDFGENGYNARCQEIDDILIPQIIGKVIKMGMMKQFNELIGRGAK